MLKIYLVFNSNFEESSAISEIVERKKKSERREIVYISDIILSLINSTGLEKKDKKFIRVNQVTQRLSTMTFRQSCFLLFQPIAMFPQSLGTP